MDDPVEIESVVEPLPPRRGALVGVAVVVVLALVVGAGVLIARSGEEAEQPVAAGTAGTADAEIFVLPAVDTQVLGASVVLVGELGSGYYVAEEVPSPDEVAIYTVHFVTQDGTRLWYSANRWPTTRGQLSMDTTPPQDPSAPLTATDARGVVSELSLTGGEQLEVPAGDFDSAVLTCFGRGASSDGEPGPSPAGPMGVLGIIEQRWLVSLMADEPGPRSPCEPDPGSPLVDAFQDLRLVGEDEWRAFMEQWMDRPEEAPSGTLVPAPAPSSSTIPSVAIPGEDEARAAVVAAFEGLDHQAADGTFPNVETGDDVAFWQPFFEEARATPQITAAGGFTVDDVAFLSEDRAHVRFQAHAEQGDQEIHVSLTGEAVRIGDRWYVSRPTMVQLLNGAVSGDRRR